jgi:GntR family transcriptional regulator/MocR family aminotransferase
MTDYLFQLPDERYGTLQTQIQEMMVGAILSKQLPAGCLLPSGRKLARQLNVSRNTVVLAYLHLMDEGFINSRERSGFYVRNDVLKGYAKAKRKKTLISPASIDWDKKLSLKFTDMPYLKRQEDWQKYPYPFLYSQYSKKIFPVADWRECVREASSLSAIYDWACDHSDHDSPELIKQIHEKLLPRRGIFVEPDEILITVGSQHAIYLIANLLLDADKTIGMENPGYADARNTFLSQTDKVKLIDVDAKGLVVDEQLEGCDCVFTTPSHQYPTTVTMPRARRRQLLKSAHENDFIIIEDDYESELNYTSTPIPALKSLDKDGRVLHLGSLSKTLAPGIRLGFLVGAKVFIQQARVLRRLMLRHPPSNNQYIIGLFLKRGYHDSLVRKMRAILYKRSKLMAKLLDEHFPAAFPRLVFGGSAYWIEGPAQIDSQQFAKRAKQVGILIESGNVFYAKEGTAVKHYFRLGFSSISSLGVEQGIPLLAKLMKEYTGLKEN